MQPFDLIILGGGISGLGVAREAARRGKRALLLEAASCCGATSNNTLRIIHGGFRYLQHLDLPRVCKSLLDQAAIVREEPDAVAPLPCVMPLSPRGLKSRIPTSCAALMYGALMRACRSPLPSPAVISAAEAAAQVPLLRGLATHGALRWHDALMLDPARIAGRLRAAACAGPVTILEHTAARAVSRAGELFEVRDARDAVHLGRAVVNTLGPFLGTVELPRGLAGSRPRWCKGINITISRQLDSTFGIGVQGAEGRLLFCVPRGRGTAIGTWYTPIANDGSPLGPDPGEIAALIDAFNAALPGANVRASEVEGVDLGVLPMLADSPGGPRLVANEEIHVAGGYVEVLSTKYTTFRTQARRVLRAI